MVKRGLMKDKNGQFYLVAAIIISVIVVGFVTMSNYSIRKETTIIQNVGQELSVESEKVLDYAIYNGQNENQLMKNFTNRYITYIRPDKDSYFLFGNMDLITAVGYSNENKIISVNDEEIVLSEGVISYQDFPSPSENITLAIDGEDYDFTLKSGENFYYIIFEETGGEEHVIRN